MGQGGAEAGGGEDREGEARERVDKEYVRNGKVNSEGVCKESKEGEGDRVGKEDDGVLKEDGAGKEGHKEVGVREL